MRDVGLATFLLALLALSGCFHGGTSAASPSPSDSPFSLMTFNAPATDTPVPEPTAFSDSLPQNAVVTRGYGYVEDVLRDSVSVDECIAYYLKNPGTPPPINNDANYVDPNQRYAVTLHYSQKAQVSVYLYAHDPAPFARWRRIAPLGTPEHVVSDLDSNVHTLIWNTNLVYDSTSDGLRCYVVSRGEGAP